MIARGKCLIFYNTCGTLLFKERSKIERAMNKLYKYLAHNERASFTVCHWRRRSSLTDTCINILHITKEHHLLFVIGGGRSSLTDMTATCNGCGRSFTRKSNLQRHQNESCRGSQPSNEELKNSHIPDTVSAVINDGIELAPTVVKKRRLEQPAA